MDLSVLTIEFAFSTLVAKNDIPVGTLLTRELFETKRPYLKGILAADMNLVIGKKTLNPISKGSHFEWSDIEK